MPADYKDMFLALMNDIQWAINHNNMHYLEEIYKIFAEYIEKADD